MPDFLSCTLYDVSRSGFSDNADSENISAGTSHHRSADPRSNSEGNMLVMRIMISFLLLLMITMLIRNQFKVQSDYFSRIFDS